MILASEFIDKKMRLMNGSAVPAGFSIEQFENFHFQWIFERSPAEVLQLRNSAHVVDMSNTNERISEQTHILFLDAYPTIPRLDFLIIANDGNRCVGGVNVCLQGKGLEIGKYIGAIEFLGRGVAKAAMGSFLDFLRVEFPGCDLFARTRKDNKRNIALNLKLGFLIHEDLDDDFLMMRMRQR